MKVELFLCLTKAHAMKMHHLLKHHIMMYGGLKVWLHILLTLALDGCE